jgi:D-glycero-alpha-D-manno-heptose 1-phosphate guanylyltransferase
MAPIQGRPFLEFILIHLSINGFQHVILSLGYQAEKIRDFFGAHFRGMNLSYVIEDSPLGTGGGMRLAIKESVENHVYVFNGDTFLDLDFCRVEKLWESSKTPIVVVRPVQDSSRYGRITVKNNKISGFIEKGVSGSGLMNAGCYILPKGIIDAFVPGEPFSFEKDYLVKDGDVMHFRFNV